MVQVMNLSPVTVQAGSVQIDANLASREETANENVDVMLVDTSPSFRSGLKQVVWISEVSSSQLVLDIRPHHLNWREIGTFCWPFKEIADAADRGTSRAMGWGIILLPDEPPLSVEGGCVLKNTVVIQHFHVRLAVHIFRTSQEF
jgi:hypothetical protein